MRKLARASAARAKMAMRLGMGGPRNESAIAVYPHVLWIGVIPNHSGTAERKRLSNSHRIAQFGGYPSDSAMTVIHFIDGALALLAHDLPASFRMVVGRQTLSASTIIGPTVSIPRRAFSIF